MWRRLQIMSAPSFSNTSEPPAAPSSEPRSFWSPDTRSHSARTYELVTIHHRGHRDGMGWVFMAESTDHRISPNKTTQGRPAPLPGSLCGGWRDGFQSQRVGDPPLDRVGPAVYHRHAQGTCAITRSTPSTTTHPIPTMRVRPQGGAPGSGSGRAVNVIRPDSVTSGLLHSRSFSGVMPTKRVTVMFAARSWREADRTPSTPGVHG